MVKTTKNVGDILQVPLPDGSFGYAQVLGPPLLGFFDFRNGDRFDVAEITAKGLAFRIWVHDDALKEWPVIGHAEPSEASLTPPLFFKQDP